MRISQINNTTFEARIKLAKPDTTKLLKGVATVATGTAALYTGLDASDMMPGDLAEGIYEAARNRHIVETPKGGTYVENWKSGIVTSSLLFSSAPLGTGLLPYGSCNIKNSFAKDIKDNQSIPD